MRCSPRRAACGLRYVSAVLFPFYFFFCRSFSCVAVLAERSRAWRLESLSVVKVWWRWRSRSFAGALRSGKYRSTWTFWLVNWCLTDSYSYTVVYLIAHYMVWSWLSYWSARVVSTVFSWKRCRPLTRRWETSDYPKLPNSAGDHEITLSGGSALHISFKSIRDKRDLRNSSSLRMKLII